MYIQYNTIQKRNFRDDREDKTMYFVLWTIKRKCLFCSLNAEQWTLSVWKNELRVALEITSLLLYFIVLNMEFVE